MKAKGLYGHIQNNNAKSLALCAVFLLSFELLAFCLAAFIDLRTSGMASGHLSDYIAQGLATAWQRAYWLPPATIGLTWLAFAGLRYSEVVRDNLEASPLLRMEAPGLFNLVENLAITAGLPCPRLFLIETEGCNAFAIGFSPSNAMIYVTRGLLQRLDEDEIEAVLAHELTHIANRDTRLLAAASLSSGIVMRLAWGFGRAIASPRQLVALVAASCFVLEVLAVIAWAGLFAVVSALAARLAISQAREFVADAGAVKLTKNPRALISALRKIAGRGEIPKLDSYLQAMLISPMGANFFASHPPLEERIGVLRDLLPAMVDAPEVRANSAIPHQARSFGQRTVPVGVAFAGAAVAGAAPNAFRSRSLALLQRAVTSEAPRPDIFERMAVRLPDVSFLRGKAQTQGVLAEIAAFNSPAWVFSHQILAPVIGINLFILAAYTVAVGDSWIPAWIRPIRSGVSLAHHESARIRTPGANTCFPAELRFDAPPIRFERPAYPENNAETMPFGTYTTNRGTSALDQPYYEVYAARRKLVAARDGCGVNACGGENLQIYTHAIETYVDRRRALTEKLQQLYGAPALAFAHDFFETSRDRDFVWDFRRRTEVGQIDRKSVMAEVSLPNAAAIDLLLSRPPADFKPCMDAAASASAPTPKNGFGAFSYRGLSQ